MHGNTLTCIEMVLHLTALGIEGGSGMGLGRRGGQLEYCCVLALLSCQNSPFGSQEAKCKLDQR